MILNSAIKVFIGVHKLMPDNFSKAPALFIKSTMSLEIMILDQTYRQNLKSSYNSDINKITVQIVFSESYNNRTIYIYILPDNCNVILWCACIHVILMNPCFCELYFDTPIRLMTILYIMSSKNSCISNTKNTQIIATKTLKILK